MYERKIQDLEDERASLLTAIRLLSEDRKDTQPIHTAIQADQPEQQWETVDSRSRGKTSNESRNNLTTANVILDLLKFGELLTNQDSREEIIVAMCGPQRKGQ